MKKNRITILLIVALFISASISLFVGAMDISFHDIWKNRGEGLDILFISRLPRLIAILCTGMGMSVSGLIMQQLCMNKFVSPSTGASISSAQFGILLALLFMPNSTLLGRSIFAFACSIIGSFAFVLLTQKLQFKDSVMVPLVGIMFSSVISGLTNYLAHQFSMTQSLSTWMTGSFSTILRGRYEMLYITLPLIILAFAFANHFNIVGMGQNFSTNLGIPYHLLLFFGIGIAALITASVVVIVGSIPFIGLIVPNLITLFKGDKIRTSLVDTALLGALFVLVCDILSRIVIFPYELPIELIIGVIGSAFFILLLFLHFRPKSPRKKSLQQDGGIA